MMNLLSTLFAITITNPTPADTCAVSLLTDPACEQVLQLTTYQRRQLALLRSQTRNRVSSLELKLRRIDLALRTARGSTRARLLRRRSVLVSQMRRHRVFASSRINGMLSPWQRRRCQLRRHQPPSRPRGHVGVTVRPTRKTHVKPSPYNTPRRIERRAPPSVSRVTRGRNGVKGNTHRSNTKSNRYRSNVKKSNEHRSNVKSNGNRSNKQRPSSTRSQQRNNKRQGKGRR